MADVGRILIPDEIGVGKTFGSLNGVDGRISNFDEDVWTVWGVWYLSARRVVNVGYSDELPAWYEPEREPPVPTFPAPMIPTLETDEDGNAIITVPEAVVGGAGTGMVALAVYLIRRRFRTAITPELDQDS
jgi:hypothetical protein